MKKIYALLSVLALSGILRAQNDTLIWEDFNGSDNWTEVTVDYEYVTIHNNTIVWELSPGMTGDEKWYNIDLDGRTLNNSNQGNEWFLTVPFGHDDEDTFEALFAASSWFASPAQADNWLVTKSFRCSNDAVLSWYSAPFQTPIYLDGYKVRVSTTTNDPGDFSDIIFTAKEYASIPAHTDSCNYANYTFLPAGPGFVHGADGTGVFDNPADCQRDSGAMVLHTVSLAQYAGQRIYIAFHHDSYDDNLIGIDNILVKGTRIDDSGINENTKPSFSTYPNPTTGMLNIGYLLPSPSDVTVKVIDNTGRLLLVRRFEKPGGQQSIQLDLTELPAGLYNVALETGAYRAVKRIIKK